LRGALKRLQELQQIKRVRNARFGHLDTPQTVVGTLHMTKQGLAFVTIEGSDEQVFIPPRFRGMAVHGDKVEVSLFAQTAKKREEGDLQEGEIVRVLERGREDLVGTLEKSKHFYIVIPDDRRIARDVFVAKESLNKARPGDKVVVKIETWGVGHLNPEGRIVEVLGRAGEVSAEMKSLLREFNLPLHFPKEVVAEAEKLPAVPPTAEIHRRFDVRDELCFTIDPEDAKDFDDAVSLEAARDGNFRLGVHIADVSYYVREGSELDREALRRGTSVYFPNMVIPMLPERLSNILCSLRPEEDRLAYSVYMTVTSKGEVVGYDIRETVIRSKRRFTYEEVEQILTGGSDASVPRAILERLLAMQQLAATLTKKRMKHGSIDFDSPEAKFRFDESGTPVEIIKKVRLQSHRLVEEFMLLANQTVARHIGVVKKEDHARPFLYRVHDSPDPDRLRELAAFVAQFGFKLNLDGGVSSKALQRLLDQVRGTEVENVINEVALRSMAKAVYSERNIGHYGLAFDYYAHFTSPIRRYPDLVVHRLLKEYAEGLTLKRRQEIAHRLPFIAKQTSAMERLAMEAERAAVKVLQVEYMKRHLGDEFQGIISGVMRFGLFIEIDELLVEGLIHVRDLDDDYYLYDEKKYALIGRRTGKQYRLGDVVRVKVIRVNPEEREIDFVMVGEQPRPARRGRA
jgi:ribonuclease R